MDKNFSIFSIKILSAGANDNIQDTENESMYTAMNTIDSWNYIVFFHNYNQHWTGY